MTKSQAFNEWMRRYIEKPEEFQAEFQAVIEFLKSASAGKEPDYGQTASAYLDKLMAEPATSL